MKILDYKTTCEDNDLNPTWLARRIGIMNRTTSQNWMHSNSMRASNEDKLIAWLTEHNFTISYKYI